MHVGMVRGHWTWGVRKYSRPQVSDVHSSVLTTRVSMFTIRCPWLKISNAPTWKEKAVVDAALGFGNSTRTRPLTRTSTSINIGSQPIHRLSAVRSSLGVRWSHGNLQLLRHPGLPALLQVIDLGANGGRLTTRRCHRRTNRAATTQAFPSERMLRDGRAGPFRARGSRSVPFRSAAFHVVWKPACKDVTCV
jgi:hypothetical protein